MSTAFLVEMENDASNDIIDTEELVNMEWTEQAAKYAK